MQGYVGILGNEAIDKVACEGFNIEDILHGIHFPSYLTTLIEVESFSQDSKSSELVTFDLLIIK